MMVLRINRIRNYRVFRDFNWKGDLPDFGRFNLIYGWNGSGKTTLSTLFRHLQTKQAIVGGEVQFLIDNNVGDGNAIASAVLPQVRVFNRDSIKRSIFEVPNEQLPAVYFLGEHSAEKQKQIETLKKAAENAAKEQLSKEGKKGTAAAYFETFCTDSAQDIKNLLTAPGGGPYNTYDARRFKETATRLVATAPPVQPLANDKRERFLAATEGSPREKIDVISVQYPDFAELTRQ